MSNKFITIDRESAFVLPPALEGWLPEDSLARFIVEVVAQPDTTRIEQACGGGGSAPYPVWIGAGSRRMPGGKHFEVRPMPDVQLVA